MAVTAKWFGSAFLSVFNKEVDFASDTIKCALFTNAHAPDQDGDRYYDGAHGMTEVANGNGYTTGGVALANKALAYDGATNVFKIDADDAVWAAATVTARYAVIYDDTPASSKPLLCYIDFGEDVSSSNGEYKIAFDAAGIATVTPS
jgi:hypothetical protein